MSVCNICKFLSLTIRHKHEGVSVFCPVFLRELVKLQREVMSAETALEQKRMARHNLLLACKVQSLPITLLSGSLDEVSEVQVRRRLHRLL